METITLSPRFQVLIPRKIREALGLMPGQKIQAVQYEQRIELIVLEPMPQARGFLRGIDTAIKREPDRA